MRIYIPETGVTRAVCVEINSDFAFVVASAKGQENMVSFIGFDLRPGRKRVVYVNI